MAAPTGTAIRRVMTPGSPSTVRRPTIGPYGCPARIAGAIPSRAWPTYTGRGLGSGVRSPCVRFPGRGPTNPGLSQERAALTIATMPALIASGSSGHASTTAARSGSTTMQCGEHFG